VKKKLKEGKMSKKVKDREKSKVKNVETLYDKTREENKSKEKPVQ